MLGDDAARRVLMPHLSREVLDKYVAQRLSESDELSIEEHLADCDTCTAVARSTLLVGNVWDIWNAAAHGEAYLAERLAQAVEQASELAGNSSWQSRLNVWADRWAGRAEAAVRVVMDAQGSASRVITEGLEALSRPGGAWQFAPVPVATPTRGPGGHGVAPNPTVALATGSQTQARVAVGGSRREVVVRLDAHPDDQQPPLVLLIAVSHDDTPQLAIPTAVAGVDYLIARFADVAPGDYVVAFEPQP